MNRRHFLKYTSILVGAPFVSVPLESLFERSVMTVAGLVKAEDIGLTLPHEHILVDFIGADKVSPSRYDAEEVFNTALPKLTAAKQHGCTTVVECTPAYLGRDVKLLQRLSKASGLHIVTNTGYYGAAKEKFLPEHAYTETANQLANRWIREFKNGIDGTGIKPGFIKTSVDAYPLSMVQQKIIESAAITHLATGLTIGIHTGDGKAAMEELKILQTTGVDPSAWMWIHAQSEKDSNMHIRAAQAGGWISFDGVNPSSWQRHLEFVTHMKKENLLHRILLSQDSGWYHVGEPDGGSYNDYNFIFTDFIPILKKNNFTEKEIEILFKRNPAEALAIKVRKTK